jgi:predicted anti-sigma-YlaC factor YlaD
LDCERLRQILPDYLDDEAAEELCREIDAHLHGCSDCEIEVDEIRQTILIYRRECRDMTMSDGARRRLLQRLSIEYRRFLTRPGE